MTTPLRAIFMGTPDFAVPTLAAMAKHPELVNLLGVYTQPDRPAGRGQKIVKPAIKVLAEELGVPIHQPENINVPEEKRRLADLMPDVVVVVAYAQFLSPGILNTPRLGCVNVHSSLLPKYRGAAPIQYAIWKGEHESGVTTMRLIPKMDAGPILLQSTIAISEEMTASELHDRLSVMGADLLLQTLQKIQGREMVEKEQDESKVSFAPAITKDQGRVNWESSGKEILCQIRALNPWPGTFSEYSGGKRLKILRACFRDGAMGLPLDYEAGDAYTAVGGISVRCADGWVELQEVQPEGKRPMTSQDFLNGNRGFGGFEKVVTP